MVSGDVRVVALGLSLTLAACLGGEREPEAITATGGASQDAPRDYRAEVRARASGQVSSRLLEVSDRLAADMCRFSETCCPHYGLLTRDDCTRMADGVVLDLRVHLDLEEEIGFDEEWAARCLALSADMSSTCVFEALPWWEACYRVATYSAPGWNLDPQCKSDDDCELLRGEGQLCWNDVCVAEIPATVGEPCKWVEGASAVPTCNEGLWCPAATADTDPLCTTLTRLGEACSIDEQCEADLYCGDVPMQLESQICTEPQQLGEPCDGGRRCVAGAACFLDEDQNGAHCVGNPNLDPLPYGATCTSDAQCPFRSPCLEGVCRHPALSDHFCKLP